jgi:tRNA-modifying protein YgfZ
VSARRAPYVYPLTSDKANQVRIMKAALLPDRGVVKVAGEDARKFLNGLITSDIDKVTPAKSAFAALLTPQGKIIADFILAEAAPADGGGFFLDCPRALAPALTQRLNFYKLRAKVIVEDLSETLGVLAVWDGAGSTEYGLCVNDPRLPELGLRCMLPPHLAPEAAADLGAALLDPAAYEAHRIALGVPRGGLDFIYGDAFPHETDMDQLGGVDFNKGCFVGQEVVSRIEHRGTARNRVVPVAFEGFAPDAGTPVSAGEKTLGTLGSSAQGRGVAMLRLDRVADALAAGQPLVSGGVEMRLVKPAWARFAFPGEAKAAE